MSLSDRLDQVGSSVAFYCVFMAYREFGETDRTSLENAIQSWSH